jgi:hypothetical protein
MLCPRCNNVEYNSEQIQICYNVMSPQLVNNYQHIKLSTSLGSSSILLGLFGRENVGSTILPTPGTYLHVENFSNLEDLNHQRYRCNKLKSCQVPWSLKAGLGVEAYLIVHSEYCSSNWRYTHNFSVKFKFISKINVLIFLFV